MGRRRVTAPKSGSIRTGEASPCHTKFSPSDSQPLVPFLNHVTEGCNLEDINPASCVPLFLARPQSFKAVRKLKAIFCGRGLTDTSYDVANSSESTLTGYVSGLPTSVVVPLTGDLSIMLDEYFEAHGFSDEDATFKKKDFAVWYGVVDVNQVYCALKELRVEFTDQWGTSQWKVFVLKPGLDIEEYRKLSIVQNERCKPANHYEPTTCELLKGLRQVYDKLYSRRLKDSRVGGRGVKLTHKEVATSYDGGNHEKNTTVKQAVSVAIRLSIEAIDAIRETMSMPCAEIILNNSEFNRRKLTSTDAILSTYDCRLFKNFLCLSTMRVAINFFNAVKTGDTEAQTNTIHRARHWCESNEFKPVKENILIKQLQFAKQALVEESKFLAFIGAEEWPRSMITTSENLLRSTSFYGDLEGNNGNDQDVLKCVWQTYRSLYPGKARAIEKNHKSTDGSATTMSPTTPEPKTAANIYPSSTSSLTIGQEIVPELATEPDPEELKLMRVEEEKEAERKRVAEQKRLEDVRRRNLQKKAESYLIYSGIETHFKTIEAFLKDVWKAGSKHFDLVLSALPDECDEETIQKLPAFFKSTLKTGSYVVLVIQEDRFKLLRDTFSAGGFKVCWHTYKVLYDPKEITRRRVSDFPQCSDELCFISIKQMELIRHPSFPTSLRLRRGAKHLPTPRSIRFRTSHRAKTS